MRISSVELTTFREERRLAHLLVLSSDSGLSGVGELATFDGWDPSGRDPVFLADLLVGRDPFEVEALVADAKVGSDGKGADLALVSAATSAMLDLAGQSLDVPIYQLLGGRVRERVRACAVEWAEDATSQDEFVSAARRTARSGYTLLRVDPFVGFLNREADDVRAPTELVRAVRDAVPDEVDLVVAADPALSDSACAEFEDALTAVEPLWLEDQVRESSEAVLDAWEPHPLPRAAGRGADALSLASLATGNRIDHLILELGRIGGLVESRRIAALAEVYHVGVVPVGLGSSVSLRAALQLAAVVPNLSMAEVRPGLAAIEDGMVSVDDRPAVGSAPTQKRGIGS
jgi:galactonate dehydratase